MDFLWESKDRQERSASQWLQDEEREEGSNIIGGSFTAGVIPRPPSTRHIPPPPSSSTTAATTTAGGKPPTVVATKAGTKVGAKGSKGSKTSKSTADLPSQQSTGSFLGRFGGVCQGKLPRSASSSPEDHNPPNLDQDDDDGASSDSSRDGVPVASPSLFGACLPGGGGRGCVSFTRRGRSLQPSTGSNRPARPGREQHRSRPPRPPQSQSQVQPDNENSNNSNTNNNNNYSSEAADLKKQGGTAPREASSRRSSFSGSALAAASGAGQQGESPVIAIESAPPRLFKEDRANSAEVKAVDDQERLMLELERARMRLEDTRRQPDALAASQGQGNAYDYSAAAYESSCHDETSSNAGSTCYSVGGGRSRNKIPTGGRPHGAASSMPPRVSQPWLNGLEEYCEKEVTASHSWNPGATNFETSEAAAYQIEDDFPQSTPTSASMPTPGSSRPPNLPGTVGYQTKFAPFDLPNTPPVGHYGGTPPATTPGSIVGSRSVTSDPRRWLRREAQLSCSSIGSGTVSHHHHHHHHQWGYPGSSPPSNLFGRSPGPSPTGSYSASSAGNSTPGYLDGKQLHEAQAMLAGMLSTSSKSKVSGGRRRRQYSEPPDSSQFATPSPIFKGFNDLSNSNTNSNHLGFRAGYSTPGSASVGSLGRGGACSEQGHTLFTGDIARKAANGAGEPPRGSPPLRALNGCLMKPRNSSSSLDSRSRTKFEEAILDLDGAVPVGTATTAATPTLTSASSRFDCGSPSRWEQRREAKSRAVSADWQSGLTPSPPATDLKGSKKSAEDGAFCAMLGQALDEREEDLNEQEGAKSTTLFKAEKDVATLAVDENFCGLLTAAQDSDSPTCGAQVDKRVCTPGLAAPLSIDDLEEPEVGAVTSNKPKESSGEPSPQRPVTALPPPEEAIPLPQLAGSKPERSTGSSAAALLLQVCGLSPSSSTENRQVALPGQASPVRDTE